MGFIGKDRANDDAEYWCQTAPTAEQEAQEDVTTCYDVTCGEDGIAHISSGKGDYHGKI